MTSEQRAQYEEEKKVHDGAMAAIQRVAQAKTKAAQEGREFPDPMGIDIPESPFKAR